MADVASDLSDNGLMAFVDIDRASASRLGITPAVAVASGVDVSVWLTGESAWFALPGRAAEFELPPAAPLPDLIDAILASGRLTLCTQCAARRDITEKDVIEGVRIAGAQVFVQEALGDETQALVY